MRENLQTLYAAVEDGFSGAPLPPFVRQEFEGYLECGLLCRGFAHLKCEGCSEHRLVAFRCKGRGFCPSCMGRRMCQTAANLIDHVLPVAPLRQWVLTVPYELRLRLAYDGTLLGGVSRIFVSSVLGWYRRRMREEGAQKGRSGAVTVVQRTSSDLKLNPHLHCVFLDGVYVLDPEGKPTFHALPGLTTAEVGDVLQVVRVRLVRYLQRQGVLAADATGVEDGDLAEREPVLSQIAAAAVMGLPPAGPELRRRPVELRGRPGVVETAPLCVTELGFSLHAATCVAAGDERGREALIRYVLRPPLATERLKSGPDGLVRIELKKAFRDGTWAIDLDPLSLLCRLAAAVPPPRLHTVRYSGVLGAACKLRSRVIPPPKPKVLLPPPDPTASKLPGKPEPPPGHRCQYRPFIELLARTFAIDVTVCPSCGGRMRLVALVKEASSIRRFLQNLGEPTEPPPMAPARGPPYGRSRVQRRQDSEALELDLFGT